jgi:membrane protein required for beta-lactamase induction
VPLIALALVLGACGATLRHAATVTEVLAQGSLACDGLSTHTGLRMGAEEQNPVLGPHPDDRRLGSYFALVGGGAYALNRWIASADARHPVLAPLARIVINSAILEAEVRAVQFNTDGGIPLCGI